MVSLGKNSSLNISTGRLSPPLADPQGPQAQRSFLIVSPWVSRRHLAPSCWSKKICLLKKRGYINIHQNDSLTAVLARGWSLRPFQVVSTLPYHSGLLPKFFGHQEALQMYWGNWCWTWKYKDSCLTKLSALTGQGKLQELHKSQTLQLTVLYEMFWFHLLAAVY